MRKRPCAFGSPTCVFYLEPSGSAAQLLEADAKLRAAFSYQRFRPGTSGGGSWVATPTAGQRGGLAVKQGPCPWSQQPKSDPHTGLLTSGQLCGWQCKRLLSQSALLQSYIFDCQGGAHDSVCQGPEQMTLLEVGRVALLLAKYMDIGGALHHGICPQRAQPNSKLSHRSWLAHQSNLHQMLAPQPGSKTSSHG